MCGIGAHFRDLPTTCPTSQDSGVSRCRSTDTGGEPALVHPGGDVGQIVERISVRVERHGRESVSEHPLHGFGVGAGRDRAARGGVPRSCGVNRLKTAAGSGERVGILSNTVRKVLPLKAFVKDLNLHEFTVQSAEVCAKQLADIRLRSSVLPVECASTKQVEMVFSITVLERLVHTVEVLISLFAGRLQPLDPGANGVACGVVGPSGQGTNYLV